MPVNLDKPDRWKADIAASVDMYNVWFMNFAPTTYRNTRFETINDVHAALRATESLTAITPQVLREQPKILPTLRMSTCPPLAVDRLIGLSGVPDNLVKTMEKGRLPSRLNRAALDSELNKIARIIQKMADRDIFVWLEREQPPSEDELYRASTIVADRLCGSVANRIIRNAQETRQLDAIKAWLTQRGYTFNPPGKGTRFDALQPGTFTFRLIVPVSQDGSSKQINIPIDVVIMPRCARNGDLPLLIEAKSAGDFTNVNKRRKEEATKVAQLRRTYGAGRVRFILFLSGYFDSGYLGYEAAEGIDWVWEHRIDDLAEFGI